MKIKNSQLHLLNATKLISPDVGILSYVSKLPIMNNDPDLMAYGIWPCNTEVLGAEEYGGRSSGCGYEWEGAFMSTIGETVERYCPAFYQLDEAIEGTYHSIGKPAVHPSEYALFHEKQYADERYTLLPFTEERMLHWFPMTDLTDGKEKWVPGGMIYIPWTHDAEWINVGTSTGLAAHTSLSQATLTALYEIIERDSFVLTWTQKIVPPKIIIDDEVQGYLDEHFPKHYEWHFFDTTYDLKEPSIFGFCFGEAEYGKFVAVGTSTRNTLGGALKKVIQEIGQAVSYFRYMLSSTMDYIPSDNFHELLDFEKHSVFYTKRPDYQFVFDRWRNAVPTKVVDLHEENKETPTETVQRILGVMKDKGYNVMFRDMTTVDVNQLGFYSVRLVIPQLIQMGGAYPFYYHGAKRLYEVPKLMGYTSYDYDNLNHYPHPFP
ncbi:MAG: YcaO-like family protein [Bacteroidota bacterium]